MASEETSETRDTPATMTTPSESQRPPAASILHKSSESAGSSSSPQHHVKICGIPPISPRVHKERSKGLHHQHSPKFPARKDRSMSLGAYPPSWRDLGMGGGMTAGGNHFVPLSPYSPSASPLVGTSVYDAAPHPSMPFMPNLSHNGPTHAAMEAAVHAERVRRQEKEKEEQDMTADELRAVLKRERSRMSKIQADLAAMRAAAVQSQAEAEVHEEGRINSLMRRVECLQQEKGRIIVELEREEEMLTNTLQKKLDEVKREKMLLEQQIEREQSSHGELKTKLTTIRSNKTDKSKGVQVEKKDVDPEAKKDSLHPETILESEEEGEDEAEGE